jgi:hypothetical protein
VTNIQLINAGEYDAVLSDNSGSVTSRVAHLEVDPAFIRITAGSIVTDAANGQACARGDYNNDGFIDLYVTNSENGSAQRCFLYHKNGNGTFTRVTNSVVSRELRDWRGCAPAVRCPAAMRDSHTNPSLDAQPRPLRTPHSALLPMCYGETPRGGPRWQSLRSDRATESTEEH